MKKLNTKFYLARLLIIFMTVMFVVSGYAVPVLAEFEKKDLKAILYKTPYYDPGDEACDLTNQAGSGTPSANDSGETDIWKSGTWNSGIQSPYILEQMVVEALKNIAQKTGTPVTSVLTEQHVLSLVGFAYGEGGDINNQYMFNPLNNGVNAPGLVVPPHRGDGTQSFVSFDAGVELMARRLLEPGYSRLADVLKDPSKNGQDFISALTYFNKYPHNVLWAEASSPEPTPGWPQGSPEEQNNYYKRKLDSLNYVAKNWASTASLEIGTLNHQSQQTRTTHPHLLQYHLDGIYNFSPGSGNDPNGNGCVCEAGAGNTGAGNVIVIDPGHSGTTVHLPKNSLGYDYPNDPEMADVFEVAQLAKVKLEAAGYKVILTKNKARDSIDLRQRAEIANNANATLAISLHTNQDPGQRNKVYYQENGRYRIDNDKNSTRYTFNLPEVSSKSQQFAKILAEEQSKLLGGSMDVLAGPGEQGGRGHAPGNMWTVQLFAKVPWVYNERDGFSAGLNVEQKTNQANGIVEGIKKAVPIGAAGASTSATGDSSGCNTSGSAVAGNIVQTAVNFSWPDKTGVDENGQAYDSVTTPRPAYKAALDKFYPNAGGRSRDCSMFTAIVMHASGVDPNYPISFTGAQLDYAIDHPEKYDVVMGVSDTSQLQAGDIMISGGSPKHPSPTGSTGAGSAGHTYIYVGPQANGKVAAQASQDDWYPRLGKSASLTRQGSDYVRIRIKL